MTIEEKAKRYDEAIKRASNLYKDAVEIENNMTTKTCEIIFPELKENEDEKIRKELTNYIKRKFENSCSPTPSKNTLANWIAWLEKQEAIDVLDEEEREFADNVDSYRKEIDVTYQKGYNEGVKATLEKQGEHKPADKVEPKFNVGDWITDGNITIQIEAIKNDCYLYCGDCVLYSTKTADKVYHLWTTQDVKDGDVLCSNQLIILFKQWEDNTDCCFVIAHAGIDISGDLQITNEHWLISNNTKPATKEQRDLLFQRIHEAGYMWDSESKQLLSLKAEPIDEHKSAWSEEDETTKNNISHIIRQYDKISKRENQPCWYVGDCLLWLNSLKDRVLPQPKQEWSEEDEEHIKRIIEHFEGRKKDLKTQWVAELHNKEIDWLKSLRPQNRWKPSDEQMVVIQEAIDIVGQLTPRGKHLKELAEQLKKLREE